MHASVQGTITMVGHLCNQAGCLLCISHTDNIILLHSDVAYKTHSASPVRYNSKGCPVPLANLNLGSVTDQLGHGFPPPEIVLEDMDKLPIVFHGINITYHGLSTHKELCCSDSTINCWSVRVYSIGCYWRIPTMDTTGWEW